jgi:Zn-dependent protease with chaperone function
MSEPSDGTVHVHPWPTERLLQALAAVVSCVVWLLLIVSIIGLLYALVLGAVFYIGHVMLVAHIRGNGVRLGPTQFPELHQMVERLSRRIGLPRVPEAYLMQDGGTLNAFATRFLSADIVVLYSDLLEACGNNTAACEMIVGHELAHVKRGHLRWQWLLLPSYLVPFLGTALSRAREYTCDRYGHALAGDTEGALLGLTILAAGGTHGPRVNRQDLVAQRASLNTGFMRLAEWLSTHPPLTSRLAEINPALSVETISRHRGTVRAFGLVASVLLVFGIVGAGAAVVVPLLARFSAQVQQADAEPEFKYEPPPADVADAQVNEDFKRLAEFLEVERASGRALPSDARELYRRWNQMRRYEFEPIDPFDGTRYGYFSDDRAYVLWSTGLDAKPDTADDIYWDSRSEVRTVGEPPAIAARRRVSTAPLSVVP